MCVYKAKCTESETSFGWILRGNVPGFETRDPEIWEKFLSVFDTQKLCFELMNTNRISCSGHTEGKNHCHVQISFKFNRMTFSKLRGY